MKLYREVLIETAEQAEALPIGITTTNVTTTRSGTWYAPPRVNIGRGLWSGDDLYGSVDMVGWSAFVPIEAEEEWGVEMSESGVVTHVVHAISREHAERTLSHQESGTARIVRRIRATPWEEA